MFEALTKLAKLGRGEAGVCVNGQRSTSNTIIAGGAGEPAATVHLTVPALALRRAIILRS